jgi:hypothetical protein
MKKIPPITSQEYHDILENSVKEYFESQGCIVEKLDTDNKGKAPDFSVIVDGEETLVEVKVKGIDPDIYKERDNILESGGEFKTDDVITSQKKHRNIVADAIEQLKAKDSENEKFKLIFFITIGYNAEAIKEQILSSLYGIKLIFPVEPKIGPKYCYFYTHSDFAKHRKYLDGAWVGTSTCFVGKKERSSEVQCQFFLNPLSIKYEQFKQSKHVQKFKQIIQDPFEWEKEGLCFIKDYKIPFEEKYPEVGKYITMDLHSMSGEQLIKIPQTHDGDDTTKGSTL